MEKTAVKLLVIDDHAIVAQGIVDFCRSLGYQNIKALSSPAFLEESIRSDRPDLIISDVNLPGGDVFIYLGKIKDREILSRALIYTGFPSDTNIISAIDMDLGGVISKEEDCSVLRQGIETVLNGRKFFSPLIKERLSNIMGDQTAIDFVSMKKITIREREVLAALGNGLPPREIARNLGISTKTVDRHTCNIMEKLQAPSRRSLIAFAVREGLAFKAPF